VGLVTERDVLRNAAGVADDVPLSVTADVLAAVRVGDVMTWQVETIEADETQCQRGTSSTAGKPTTLRSPES
jgi:CBS domain-containing protein